jgi:hypothetical protein
MSNIEFIQDHNMRALRAEAVRSSTARVKLEDFLCNDEEENALYANWIEQRIGDAGLERSIFDLVKRRDLKAYSVESFSHSFRRY